MHLLIDGHNLIGSNLFPEIHLSDEDDEAKLVQRLRIWQSRPGKSRGSAMTIVFDRGIPGGIDVKMGGPGLTVVFAADPAQADDLIRRRLRKAKKDLVLVTNDDALVREATAYQVQVWRGEEFVERMRLQLPERPEAGMEQDIHLSESEVNEWLALFRASAAAKKRKKPAPQSPEPPATGPSKRRKNDLGKKK